MPPPVVAPSNLTTNRTGLPSFAGASTRFRSRLWNRNTILPGTACSTALSALTFHDPLNPLETRSWAHVQHDHQKACHLLYRAEWVLSIVSGLTLLLSVWISFVLPQQVVKPLQELKEAVDHTASGNYLIDFELRGQGEVVELAKSVRRLVAHMQ